MFIFAIIFFFISTVLHPAFAFAATYSSASFQVLDPVISIGGGLSTSTSFSLHRSVGQPAIGLSNAAGWTVKGGFLYFDDPAPAEDQVSELDFGSGGSGSDSASTSEEQMLGFF